MILTAKVSLFTLSFILRYFFNIIGQPKSCLGNQLSSLALYPFHLTRYKVILPSFFSSTMPSTFNKETERNRDLVRHEKSNLKDSQVLTSYSTSSSSSTSAPLSSSSSPFASTLTIPLVFPIGFFFDGLKRAALFFLLLVLIDLAQVFFTTGSVVTGSSISEIYY